MTKRNLGRVCLGLALLCGLVPGIFGWIVLRKWAGVSSSVIGFSVLFVLGGTLMVLSAIWLLVSWGRTHLPLRIGGIASIRSTSARVAQAKMAVSMFCERLTRAELLLCFADLGLGC